MVLLKRMVSVLSITAVLLSLGCSPSTPPEYSAIEADKPVVITTLFPLYDFSRTLLGTSAEVSLLLPPGVEAHAYEPTPQDIVRISRADVFIYTGEAMEPWAHDILKTVQNPGLTVIDASAGIPLQHGEDHEEEHGDGAPEEDAHEDEHSHEGGDPHIWLDPVLAAQMADTIATGLKTSQPQLGGAIEERRLTLRKELEDLHQRYVSELSRAQGGRIVYAGHFAFSYMAKRYGFTHLSPYEGFSPNAEPTPQKIAALTEALRASGSKVVYYQELIDPRVARVMADETGAQMLMLHGAHNVSKEELAQGVTYTQIMKQNLENLKKGLSRDE